jgi:hypothetical protein
MPARPDLVQDGVYDVHVAGTLAYASVHYSDQEDAPAQSVVEMIDLGKTGPRSAKTSPCPVVTHRHATDADFAASGLTLARGAIQVAGARNGVMRIDLPSLTVIDHWPAAGQGGVSPLLEAVRIELSAAIDAGHPARRLGPGAGRRPAPGRRPDRTVRAGLRTARRRLQPPRHRAAPQRRRRAGPRSPLPRVLIEAGLTPLTGRPLAGAYAFRFSTAASALAVAPDIVSICTAHGSADGDVCLAAGDIRGGTEIVVQGYGFGDDPVLELGGQPLAIDARHCDGALCTLRATTVPNSAGPAAVKVTNAHRLQRYRAGRLHLRGPAWQIELRRPRGGQRRPGRCERPGGCRRLRLP